MIYNKLKEEKIVSFYESTSQLNLLTADHLLSIPGPLNVVMESVETIIDIL